MRLSALLCLTLAAQPEQFTKQHCAACHNPAAKVGGFVLEGTPQSRPDVWEKAIKRVRAGEMPPAKMPRPTEAAASSFVHQLTTELEKAAP